MEGPVQEVPQIEETAVEDAETDLLSVIESQLSPRSAQLPVYIDDLEDAVELDLTVRVARFKPKPGERVVIEKWFEGRWLGTALYTVRSVDIKTGDLGLHDDANMQAAMANYVTGILKYGWRFKLPIPGLRLDKREAPKYVEPKVERPVNSDGTKKRGRPKGSKNRSPEEIRADNAWKQEEKLRRQQERG